MSPTVRFPSRPTHGSRSPACTPPCACHGFAHFSPNIECTPPHLTSHSSVHNSPLAAHLAHASPHSAICAAAHRATTRRTPQPNYAHHPSPFALTHSIPCARHRTPLPSLLDTHHSTLFSLPLLYRHARHSQSPPSAPPSSTHFFFPPPHTTHSCFQSPYSAPPPDYYPKNRLESRGCLILTDRYHAT